MIEWTPVEWPRSFARRVQAGLRRIVEAHPRGRVLVVTHWGVLSTMRAVIDSAPPNSWAAYGPWTACGITEVGWNGNGWRIRRLNDSRHLEAKEHS